jgi:hypothetical protein
MPAATTGAGAAVLLVYPVTNLLHCNVMRSGPEGIRASIGDAGGSVQVDETAPGKPIVAVDFDFLPDDAKLLAVKPTLESLPQLRRIKISKFSNVTDAGLLHLKGLTQLDSIDLYCLGVTTAGVEDLRKALPDVKVNDYRRPLFVAPTPEQMQQIRRGP